MVLVSSGKRPWLLEGSKDPWLCVSDFHQFYFYSELHFAPWEIGVNSGMYLAGTSASGQKPSFKPAFTDPRLASDLNYCETSFTQLAGCSKKLSGRIKEPFIATPLHETTLA